MFTQTLQQALYSTLFSIISLQTYAALDFETEIPGSGELITIPAISMSGFAFGASSASIAGDPIQGILASSDLGSGQAAYLGGDGTALTLTENEAFQGFLFFPGLSSDLQENIKLSDTPLRRVTADFIVERNEGTNVQNFIFKLFDSIDSEQSGFASHSLIQISPDNSVEIADNSIALENAVFVYTPTGYSLRSGVPYRLYIEVNYISDEWSALIASYDGVDYFLIAEDRSTNSPGYSLSGWTKASGLPTLDIEMNTIASESNKGFADRLIFDNIDTVDSPPRVDFDANFESLTPGAGELITDPFSGMTAFTFGVTNESSVGDPIQGVLASSPINTGQAGYLGGAGTLLTLPETTSFLGLLTFPEDIGAIPQQRTTSGEPLRTVTADFVVERNAGTNSQSYTFYIFDPRDLAGASSFGYHSYVSIRPDNTIAIADNLTALENASFFYTSTGKSITPGVPYRLSYSIDYVGATWSASIVAIDGSERIEVATDRLINTEGYVLSGWATETTLDIEFNAFVSDSNRGLADRLIFDNISVVDSERPALDLPISFDTLPIGSGNLVDNPSTGFSGFLAVDGAGRSLIDDPLQGVLANSFLNTGRAGYLGGDGTNTSLLEEDTFLNLLVFPGAPSDAPENRTLSDEPYRTVTVDFFVERNGGTNNQVFDFFLYDAIELDLGNTFSYHSYVHIAADNSVHIADNRIALRDAGYVYFPTGYTLRSDVAYRLFIEVNYLADTWSATIVSFDGLDRFVLAEERTTNTGGYTLTGWTNPTGQASLDIQMSATANSANQDFADRLVFDNINTIDSIIPVDFLSDFEGLTVGAGNLVTDPFSGVSGFAFGATNQSPVGDPIQGVLATSALDSGQAGYLGGAGTLLTLPEINAYFGILAFPGHPSDVPTQRLTSGEPLRTVSTDFVLERNAGTNSQAFTFFIYDAVDLANGNTFGYHSYISIQPDNTIWIADNRNALQNASFIFTPTGKKIKSGVPYKLTYTIDYDAATWSAVITSLDGLEKITVAKDRFINTEGYVLSGWTTQTTLDIEMGSIVSNSNRGLADRLIFDNITTTDSPRPPLDLPITFNTLPIGSGNLLTNPFSGFTGFLSIDSSPSAYVGDSLQGVLKTSSLGSGRAGYVGGDGTSLTLPETNAFLYSIMFPASSTDFPENRAGTDKPFRTVSLDFAILRNGSSNHQQFDFFLYDAADFDDGNTFEYHSYVHIAADNSVGIADNSVALDAASYNYTSTGVTLQSDTPYRLTLTVDYDAATWSATIISFDGSERYVLADERSTNSAGYTLSGWTNATGQASIDIQMTATVSESNKGLNDRLIFDNIQTVDTAAEVSFDTEIASSSIPLEKRGPLDDADGDGVSNLLEYALGLNPAISTSTPFSAPIIADDTFVFKYKKAKPDQFIYIIECTTDITDPNSWTTLSVSQGDTDSEGETEAGVSTEGSGKFLRLRVIPVAP